VAAVDGSLVFIGFMGAGKSRALRRAAEAGIDGADTDARLTEELGMPIPEFFERDGEAEFRRREAELVLRVLGEGHDAVALGGGAVLSEEVRRALREHTVVWLRVPVAELWRRAEGSDRPLAADADEFERLHAEREPLYRSLADAVLLSADAVGEALTSLQALGERDGLRLIWAESGSGQYPVWIGPGAIGSAPRPDAERWFCITDTRVATLFGHQLALAGPPIEVEPGEGSKTFELAGEVLRDLAAKGVTRSDCIVALGGGVIGDFAGFCAAVYQRGVPVLQVPTTLLAQVDSAYGGKTGVDLPEAKNYIGAYHQPAAVIADTETLRTLPAEELRSGFVEVLKTALLAGSSAWSRVRALGELEATAFEELVFDCALHKLEVVAADERDTGLRATLNLGHTVGHAIETAGGYGHYRHGEAVGLGLLAALRLSGAEELRAEVAALLDGHGLPTSLDGGVATDDVIAAVGRDKKLTSRGGGFVLLRRPGEPLVGQQVDPDSVRAAVEELRS
jgi:shikimate kinase/3-dehydroquinate synthase